MIADGARRGGAGRRDGRRDQRGLGRRRPRCCSRRRPSTRAACAAPPSAWACTPRRRIASSARVDANGIPHAALRAAAHDRAARRRRGQRRAGRSLPACTSIRGAVSLSLAGLTRTAGFEIDARAGGGEADVDRHQRRRRPATALTAIVPTFRPDISIEPDLIEEVMRLTGYDRVPARLPPGTRAPSASPEALADRARDVLAAQGLHEAVTWGFVPRPWLEALGKARRNGAPLSDGIAVKNPISADYEVMRTSLFPGLAEAARRNLMRGVPDVALFEVGPVVLRGADAKEHPSEPMIAAGILIGRRPEWLKPGAPLDFFDAKRIVDELLRALGIDEPSYRLAGGESPIVHPGIAARIFSGPQGDRARGRAGGRGASGAAQALRLDRRRAVLRGRARRGRRRAARAGQRVAAALSRGDARRVVLDRRYGHRRRAARRDDGGGRAAAARACGARGLPRPALRGAGQEGDALDHDLSRRRPDADRR